MIANAQVRGSRSDEGGAAKGIATSQPANNTGKQPQATEGLFVVFILAALVWMFFAAVLIYHFRRYGKGDGKVQLAQALYIVGSIMLLVIALFAIL